MFRLICLTMMLLFALSAFANDQDIGSKGPEFIPDFSAPELLPLENSSRIGGETIESAFHIEALPFYDSGNTVGMSNDYNDICEIGSNNAPDVVYSFTPLYDMLIDFDLCQSSFHNQIFVYEDAYVAGDPYACVPGYYYGAFPCETLSARMAGLPVYSGHTYYFIIDGYSGSTGNYVLSMEEVAPCDVVPSADAIPEGEPELSNEYVDEYNTGCNSNPPTLQLIDYYREETGCVEIAGRSGYYRPNNYQFTRDTDWFIVVAAGTEITASIVAEVPFSVFINVGDCPVIGSAASHVDPCDTGALTYATVPGTEYFIFVAPQGLSHWTHELTEIDYEMEVCGHSGVVQIHSTTWDALKANYR